MNKSRLEAFSDGVMAVLITVMVLEMKVPNGPALEALRPLLPVFVAYALSFVFLGIYWNNHHHLLQAAEAVNGRILWANLHLLFWLSLIPVLTAWMGQNSFAPWPTALYGLDLFISAVAFTILSRELLHQHGKNSVLARALENDFKGKISLLLYALAIPLAFVAPRLSYVLYSTVAVIWIVPDRRIEKVLIR